VRCDSFAGRARFSLFTRVRAYCAHSKNYQHLSATDYLSADDVSTFVKQVFQHYDEKELTAYMNKRKHVTKHLLPRLWYDTPVGPRAC
jgi:hypothetical protein